MKKQTITRNRNGHGYMDMMTSCGIKKFRVDEELSEKILKNQKNVVYDTYNEKYYFNITRGKNAGHKTTLQRWLYGNIKTHIGTDNLSMVRFRNGLDYDFRLSNLTTKRKSS